VTGHTEVPNIADHGAKTRERLLERITGNAQIRPNHDLTETDSGTDRVPQDFEVTGRDYPDTIRN